MTEKRDLTAEALKGRAIRFFDRYGSDLDQIRQLLNIRLSHLALAYTIEHNLPPEAIVVSTRLKTLQSFLRKLANKDWPQLYYPTEVIKDLIGARVVCWFVDDCQGIKELISSSKHLTIEGAIDDYIHTPKTSGYRAVHLLARVGYDCVQRQSNPVIISSEEMVCEIQIRTKLQDAWGDITHEFHYKAKCAGIENRVDEQLLAEISNRLADEDESLLMLRDVYQRFADEKARSKHCDHLCRK